MRSSKFQTAFMCASSAAVGVLWSLCVIKIVRLFV